MFQSLQEQTLAASIFLREMLPMLPSFADSFTVAQPLTRIRDIAHRNDIPKEMKLRIKTQLQNKIHRCCDPADLGVCREILEELRLSSCNPSLVAEMEIFYSELKAFFNDVNLRELVESQSDCVSQETKTALLAPHSHCAVSVLAKLDVIRRARASLVSKIHNGESELQTRTQCLFLDLRLEQRAFALLSELDLLIENSESAVVALIRGLGCGIDHLRLTFPFDAELECIDKARAILNQNVVGNHDWLLVHCFARRLLNWHADVADIFLVLNDANLSLQPLVTNKRESALRLGEGCVRSHVVFQTSKFVSRVHRLACGRLGLPSVDVIAAGVREGCLLVHVDRVPASQLVSRVICEETSVDVVLLVNDLSGDEQVVGLDGEIGALLNTRVRVVGLIARQSIPALSHLGVRARQEGIVMVTVDWVEREAVRHVMSLVGQFISLDTTATDYSSLIKPAPFIAPTKRDRKARPHTQPSVDLVTWDVYFGKEISKELCGSKAHRCGQLERIADSAEFDAPKSLALPFSTIHILLNADPALKAEYNCLMEDLLTSQDNIRKATLAGRLQELITELRFPSDMASRVDSAVSRLLGDRELCMVRSSANVEDLKGESAAGLFSSMPAVKSTVHARILEVLASLYSSSAALSLSQIDKAHMAVLIQPLDASVEMSCIVHSKAPGVPESHVYAELAMGHGEVLASGSVKGTPHRLLIPRDPNEAVRVQSYSNLRCKAAVSDDGLLTWAPTTLQDDHFLQSARLRQ
ncbi:MAG: uncharacterized protein KVP18_003257 [Porospora cf. gigantea A]|nr:MAG: hypothetical protein KVP18_003257 [Porospora cf. gigantea A]